MFAAHTTNIALQGAAPIPPFDGRPAVFREERDLSNLPRISSPPHYGGTDPYESMQRAATSKLILLENNEQEASLEIRRRENEV